MMMKIENEVKNTNNCKKTDLKRARNHKKENLGRKNEQQQNATMVWLAGQTVLNNVEWQEGFGGSAIRWTQKRV